MLRAVMAEGWSLFTSHGRVLLVLAERPTARLREVAALAGITERATQGIVNDLVSAGYVERTREGRRNRYLVRGDHPLGGGRDVRHLLGALARDPDATPESGQRRAAVLACSDFRYQEPLRELLAAQGLLSRSEVFLWPGGSAALGGPESERILEAMTRAVGKESAPRLVLVAHADCHASGVLTGTDADPIATGRAVLARRRRGIEEARRTFGLEPELWFLSGRGARRVRMAAAARQAPGG